MRNRNLQIFFLIFCTIVFSIAAYFLLRKEQVKTEIVLYGNVDVRLVDIGFRVQGRVDRLFFEEGDCVEKGQLLATLDKTPYDAQINQAAANVEAVYANLKNAEILLKRRKDLLGVGGVSQEDLDNAQANRDQLYANWLQAQAALDVQKDTMSYTEVFAPADGVILTRIREPGTVVNPTDPVYTLSVASPVWIRAFAEERDLGDIEYGMPVEIYTDTPGSPVYVGQVGFISPVAEFTPKTVQTLELRTDLVYRLRIYAENPDWRLKQGMPVTVKLKLRRKHD